MHTFYWQSLKQIAQNIWRLFQNFWHWNLSKVAIFSVTLVTALVISIPFIAIIWWMVSGLVGGLGVSALQDLISTGILPETVVNELLKNYWMIGGILICWIIVFAIVTSMMTYGYYLTMRVYQSYLNGGRLHVLENEYFSVQHIWKFLGILGWSSLYLMVPILYAFLGTGILMYLTTVSGVIVSRPIIGGILFVSTVIFLFYFIKIAVHVMFSYILMLQETALETPARKLVQDSIALAKGNVLKIIALLLPFAIAIALGGVALQTIKEIRDIRVLKNAATTAVLENPTSYIDDHAFIQREYLNVERLNEEQKWQTLAINNAFNPQTTGIDEDYLKAIYPYIILSGTMESNSDIAWQVAMTLLSFFILEGVMLMVYLSIYHILVSTVNKETSHITSVPKNSRNLFARFGSEKNKTPMEVEMPKIVMTEVKKVTTKKVTSKKTTKDKATPVKKEAPKKTAPKKSVTKK